MRIVQFYSPQCGRRLGLVIADQVLDVTSVSPDLDSTYAAFLAARRARISLAELLRQKSSGAESWSYAGLLSAVPATDQPHLLPPLDHPDAYRTFVTGTGLTHLGSMRSRNQMHVADVPLVTGEAAAKKTDQGSDGPAAVVPPPTDSARMFQWGLEGGKPERGQLGVAPEWFFKGTGHVLRGPQAAIEIPDFALDGGEEPEIVGCYVVDDEGQPFRLGFALGNEWSDHATEKKNYLYLAPSKLRQCAVGPELILGHDFQEVQLRCKVTRRGEVIYDSGVLYSGERHMCHSLANLEDHHFKFPEHRRPGDVHLHFMGTSKLSYGQRTWSYQEGDVVQVESLDFSAPLVNRAMRGQARSTSRLIPEA